LGRHKCGIGRKKKRQIPRQARREKGGGGRKKEKNLSPKPKGGRAPWLFVPNFDPRGEPESRNADRLPVGKMSLRMESNPLLGGEIKLRGKANWQK